MNAVCRLLALSLSLFQAGCETATQAPVGPDLGVLVLSRDYRVEGGNLIYSIQADTVSSCSDSTLIATVRPLRYDTNRFELSRDSLRIVADTFVIDSGMVESVTHLRRSGSGSGLDGTWRWVGTRDRVVSGGFTRDESLFRARLQSYNDGLRDIAVVHFVLADGKIRFYGKADFSATFLYGWTHPSFRSEPDSALYAISIRPVDATTVEMQGLVNRETVTLRSGALSEDGKSFSSDDPAHAPFRQYTEPRECPNRLQPEWYDRFLDANLK